MTIIARKENGGTGKRGSEGKQGLDLAEEDKVS
jgi:hypothetical protein